ncbi:hypothetical protein HKX48_002121 [Thoreauomyces humboldtii]|nr:hypothetical protein HKX48_002121 [Thoreauomyces humboldtii]
MLKLKTIFGSACLFVTVHAAAVASRDQPILTFSSKTSPSWCLDIQNLGTANGTPLQGYPCNAGDLAEGWWIQMVQSNNMVLRNPSTNKCVAIQDASQDDGAQAIITDCDGSQPNQLINWPNPAGDLSFVHSNKCLDVDVNTRKMQQWTCQGTPNQKWQVGGWTAGGGGNGGGGTKPFFGLAYSDVSSVQQAQSELTFLSQYTHAIRTYDVQTAQFALQAISNANLPMKVLINIWSDEDAGGVSGQQDLLVNLARQFGGLIYGVSVGNEPSNAGTAVAHSTILGLVQSTRSMLQSQANWNGPVSVIDIVSGWLSFNGDYTQSYPTDFLQQLNPVYVDTYPMYAGFDVDSGAAINYIDTVVTKQFGSECNGGSCMNGKSPLVITETGHPSAGSCSVCGNAVAGIEQMNKYLQQVTCYAAQKGIDLFVFEAFDKPAGQAPAGSIENHFGVFKRDGGLGWKEGVNDLSQTQPASCKR